jgi:hypothetical protein
MSYICIVSSERAIITLLTADRKKLLAKPAQLHIKEEIKHASRAAGTILLAATYVNTT